MKITEKLLEDHNELRSLSKSLSEKKDNSDFLECAELTRKIKLILKNHSLLEDIFFYPIFRACLSKSPGQPVDMHYMDHLELEHKHIDTCLENLENALNAGAASPNLENPLKDFLGALNSHMEKEEQVVFPLAEKILGQERLEELYQGSSVHPPHLA